MAFDRVKSGWPTDCLVPTLYSPVLSLDVCLHVYVCTKTEKAYSNSAVHTSCLVRSPGRPGPRSRHWTTDTCCRAARAPCRVLRGAGLRAVRGGIASTSARRALFIVISFLRSHADAARPSPLAPGARPGDAWHRRRQSARVFAAAGRPPVRAHRPALASPRRSHHPPP